MGTFVFFYLIGMSILFSIPFLFHPLLPLFSFHTNLLKKPTSHPLSSCNYPLLTFLFFKSILPVLSSLLPPLFSPFFSISSSESSNHRPLLLILPPSVSSIRAPLIFLFYAHFFLYLSPFHPLFPFVLFSFLLPSLLLSIHISKGLAYFLTLIVSIFEYLTQNVR